MTHPPATCELCGDTGLYSPSALPCPNGCEEFDIVDNLKFIGSMSLDQDAARLSYQAAEYVSNLLAALSEAEQREKDATEATSAFSQDQMRVIDRLDAALCNFLNGVGDEVDPRLWIPETKRNLGELADAYNQCHVVKVMDTLSAIKRSKDAAMKYEVR